MESKSISRALPKITWIMILILLILILPMNLLIQMQMLHISQLASSKEMFGQLEQIIKTNEEDTEVKKKAFKDKCIQSVEMVAYYTENNKDVIGNLEQTRKLAQKTGVDELHYFTKEGKIYAGTHPEYYGLTFYSGKQMGFFLPMLKDKNLRLCQDITPNTAESKPMQYAAVWLGDGSGIVQIGMEPKHLLKEIEEKRIQNIFSNMPLDIMGNLHILDKDTKIILASTAEQFVGMDMSSDKNGVHKSLSGAAYRIFEGERYYVYQEECGDYLLMRSYKSDEPVRGALRSTLLVLIYIGVCIAGAIVIIRWYINKQLIGNLNTIIGELELIEEGDLENISVNTGISEFDELQFYINQMIDSIRSNWDKLSYIMGNRDVPIGILEKNLFYNRTFVNKQMLRILGIAEEEKKDSERAASLVQDKLQKAEEHELDRTEHICKYDRNGETVYLNIEKNVQEQSITYYVRDVSSWWGEIGQLIEESEKDELTGLCNRRGFMKKVSGMFEKPELLGYAAVVMIDADNLKKINDVYGHFAGDAYLKSIAEMLQHACGKDTISARLGGDEFVLFICGADSLETLESKIDSVREKRGNRFVCVQSGIQDTLEFSMGAAVYPDDGVDLQSLINLADENMYQEKKMRKK